MELSGTDDRAHQPNCTKPFISSLAHLPDCLVVALVSLVLEVVQVACSLLLALLSLVRVEVIRPWRVTGGMAGCSCGCSGECLGCSG